MWYARRWGAAATMMAALAACGGSNVASPPASRDARLAPAPAAPAPTPAPSVPPPDAATAPDAGTGLSRDDLDYCVAETNRYRASVGAAPLASSPDIDAYAARAARADGISGRAHGYTSGPDGPQAFAENEAVRWRLSRYGSVRNALAAALAAFWNEGPGGTHYENMRGPHRAVGCGVFVDGDAVTIVQHFR